MPLIYEPKGKAREYSPLALNIFSGCDHGCTYCYVPSCCYRSDANTNPKIRENLASMLEKELTGKSIISQVLLSFLCDPYPVHDQETAITRSVLEILHRHSVPTAILTKGGSRCLRDLDVFGRFSRIKVGATLTFLDPEKSSTFEPNAALPQDRLNALRALHASGIRTWASIEPVIDPVESLAILEKSLPYVDHYKVGKLNHNKKFESEIDWTDFGMKAIGLLNSAGKQYYIKQDLQPFVSGLKSSQTNPDFLALAA